MKLTSSEIKKRTKPLSDFSSKNAYLIAGKHPKNDQIGENDGQGEK